MICFTKKFQENLVYDIRRPVRRLTIMVDWREVDTYEEFSWEPGATCELFDEGSKAHPLPFRCLCVVVRVSAVVGWLI